MRVVQIEPLIDDLCIAGIPVGYTSLCRTISFALPAHGVLHSGRFQRHWDRDVVVCDGIECNTAVQHDRLDNGADLENLTPLTEAVCLTSNPPDRAVAELPRAGHNVHLN